jgi:hypothetical protein
LNQNAIGNYHDCSWWKRILGLDEKPPQFLMGAEVEVEQEYGDNEYIIMDILRSDLVADVQDDGSLNEYGYEVITHPASLQAHKELAPDMLRNIFNTDPIDGDSGMHVHVSRDYFSVSALMRLDYFMNNNDRELSIVAKRDSGSWARFTKKGDFENYGKDSDRYCALNLCPDKTVEFRIFDAVFTEKAYFENIEFVHAVCTWIKNIEDKYVLDATTWNRFSRYVKRNGKRYPKLKALLKRREI